MAGTVPGGPIPTWLTFRCSNGRMDIRASDGRVIQGPEAMSHLRVPFSGICWWCQERPATTGEHKFKRSDLTRMLAEDDTLIWGDLDGNTRQVRGRSGVNRDRHRVVKFPKSLCEPCNNRRSKPFDDAYDLYSAHVHRRPWLGLLSGLDFTAIFGEDWQQRALNLARYYAKHFGCRMTSSGVAVPASIRAFLDGATDMPDGHMALVTTTSSDILRSGLSISPEFVAADAQVTHLTKYVAVAYVGPLGVRYEWREEGFVDHSQFFHHPFPVISTFSDDVAVFEGRTQTQNWPTAAPSPKAPNRPRL